MKILVVDDSRTMRKIIRSALEGMGYSASSIIEAADGAEAMGELERGDVNVDLILADWNMPKMDGLELLNKIQGVEVLRDIPFVMVTGEAQLDRVLEAVLAGARDFIVKPFTPETFRQKILAIERELLNRRKPTDTAVMRFDTAMIPAKPEVDQPFLAQLPDHLVGAIYESARHSEHEESELLVGPSDIVRSLNIVEKGQVEIVRDGNGCPSDVRGPGECFGELSFFSGDPAALSARARTDVMVASVWKDDFEDLLASYPHLSFHLTRLLAKRARKADAKAASELERGLAGSLDTIPLAELVQTLHNSRKTGLLRVFQDRARTRRAAEENQSASGTEEAGPPEADFTPGDGDEGEIYFVDGNVTHARMGGREGEEAFYRLVTLGEGSFTFETGSRPIEHAIFRATMGLLIEGMRRQDEFRSARA